MKAVRIHAYKQTPAVENIPMPEVAADQVLVRIEAAALNPLDALVVSGGAAQFFNIQLPITPGTDFAGMIVEVGSAVENWQAGDRVIVWTDAGSGGGFAQFAAVPASACVTLPLKLSAAEGAAIPIAATTAWHSLFSTAGLKAGETVLIHAAAGGVGTFAIQFAKRAGARVIATASGDGIELAARLGADQVIDYTSQDFVELVHDVDLVLDLVGGETQLRSFEVLRRGGRLISTAMPPDTSIAQSFGVSASIFYAAPYAERLGELVSAVIEQEVTVVIDREVPLTAFADAWARLTSGHARGKIILKSEIFN
ncbi:NADP-dependent oxidoreductase [Phytopseudomonas seleniipraecipitans]|jgi:NADPH:quinone reductase-like Zn-dependent oxidoreductase|uniref:NADPH:quinone reductase n=1 Tax=Phytopseudomonas seleniipraecipitans TaxID=640205 RepID=A0A1G7GIM4_9GAMM|nr:NADP-dependent oxidoreductase [Pseudomonas seleniipraecipitans]SDE88018.1 NADPH:quinone reductase [Pseudomonas seleniipraecipitans]